MNSKSLWKSVVVKSLRMGWPAGLDAALVALSPSVVKGLLWSGVFEDVFPLPSELEDVAREIVALDFEALCSRETHHGQGLSSQFCDLKDEATNLGADDYSRLHAIAKGYGVKVPWGGANCFWTWVRLSEDIVGGKREVDTTPFRGIPLSMADGHTKEGCELGQRCTVLSGFYHQHRRLGEVVQEGGWEAVRSEVHDDAVLEAVHQSTFWN